MSVVVKIAEQSDNINFKKLKELINEVYLASEASLWVENHRRVSLERLTEIFEKQELIIALIGGEVVGCIHLEPINEDCFKFKMVAVSFNHKRKGVGNKLVSFAEEQAKQYGACKMQLELLVPDEAEHPDKIMLEKWYTSIGYELAEVQSVDYCHDGLAQFLKTPCKAFVYRKALI